MQIKRDKYLQRFYYQIIKKNYSHTSNHQNMLLFSGEQGNLVVHGWIKA